MIKANTFSFTYEDSKEGISDINFEINEGETVLLTGNSGCGKTTLLRCLNGLIPAVTEGDIEGELLVDNKDYRKLKMHELNKEMGSVFQNPRSQFFTDNTTSELVFPMENYGFSKEKMEQKVSELKKEFMLEDIMDRNIFTLSSGERQMLALACARTMGQKILLFDEPSANLDYGNAMRLGRLIAKMKKNGITVIVADHRFYYLHGVLDKALFMDGGHLKVYNSEEDFMSSGYNTRSFDIFSINTGFHEKKEQENCVASIKNVYYKDILKNISLDLNEGEITVIVGNNGAGKTTLAKVFCKSIKPEEGRVDINELPFFIMQDPDYQLFGTSVENELSLVKNDSRRIEESLKYLNLYEYKDAHPFELSGGQKQRLQIGMAMLCDRDVIIFDEPTSGLDVSSMKKVSEEICRISKNSAVMVISHDYEFIRNVADRIVYLKDGSIEENFILNKDTLEKLNNIFREMERERNDEKTQD